MAISGAPRLWCPKLLSHLILYYALGYLINPPSAWPGFSQELRTGARPGVIADP